MILDNQIAKISSFQHLELLANQIVEGFISGMHKSPFHGFSVEFNKTFGDDGMELIALVSMATDRWTDWMNELHKQR